MKIYRELISGEIYNESDINIIMINKDQWFHDNQQSTTYEGALPINDYYTTGEFSQCGYRSTPFIEGDECLYEIEEVKFINGEYEEA